MRRPYKNENSLFKDFQEFLSIKQQVPEKRLPHYLRWVSRFHEFCNRSNIDYNAPDNIAAYVHDLAKYLEDWQVRQARESVRLYLWIPPARREHLRLTNTVANAALPYSS